MVEGSHNQYKFSIEGSHNQYKFSKENAIIFCDSLSAIFLIENWIYHERTKYTIKYHFLRTRTCENLIQRLIIIILELPIQRNESYLTYQSKFYYEVFSDSYLLSYFQLFNFSVKFY